MLKVKNQILLFFFIILIFNNFVFSKSNTINSRLRELCPSSSTIDNDLPIVFLVHNTSREELTNPQSFWNQSVNYLCSLNHIVYYYQLNKWKKVERNADNFFQKILLIKKKYPDKEIDILGYSAGGVVGLLAFDRWKTELLDFGVNNIKLFTISSPINGYGAPWISLIAAPFVGRMIIDIGRGVIKKIHSDRIENCQHHITIDCKKDRHACMVKTAKIFPQIVTDKKIYSLEEALNNIKMPCGNETVKLYKHDSHSSILLSTIKNTY